MGGNVCPPQSTGYRSPAPSSLCGLEAVEGADGFGIQVTTLKRCEHICFLLETESQKLLTFLMEEILILARVY
jgi:hypothetical protein